MTYTEDSLVEQPAISLFAELRWETASASEEVFGVSGTFGRDSKLEVVLTHRLRAALEKFNPDLPAEALDFAIAEVTRDRSEITPAAANREIWQFMRDGLKVSIADKKKAGQKPERVPMGE